jgi:hypothetical protein
MRFPDSILAFKIADKANLMTSWGCHDGYFSTANEGGNAS